MNLLRCAFAGLASLVVGGLLLGFGGVLAIMFLSPRHGHSSMAFYAAAIARSPIAWAVGLFLFVVGFIGEYRRSA